MTIKKQIAIFMGTRPEAIKMVPIIRGMTKSSTLTPVVVSTGQHKEILEQVIQMYALKVDHDMNVMTAGQSLPQLSSVMLEKADAILQDLNPSLCVVQGDTTSALMVSLASFYRRIPIAHVEAGLRTWDTRNPFPEEANRRMISPIADLHFCPTMANQKQLLAEGIDQSRVTITGNTVIDALMFESKLQSDDPMVCHEVNHKMSELLGEGWNHQSSVLITSHRRENFGQGLLQICTSLIELAQDFQETFFIFPVHPNPNVKEPVYQMLGGIVNIKLIAPQPYRIFVALLKHCKLVLTDSGGVQEEAPALGKRVLVTRTKTERPEGVKAGVVKLVGTDSKTIVSSMRELMTSDEIELDRSMLKRLYGDGKAALRIIQSIESYF